MKGRLWLLAWISTTFAIETRRLKINLNEEVLIGSEIANLKTELNFGKDRVFSLQTPSDIFQLRYFNELSLVLVRANQRTGIQNQ